jgi:DNA repair protein RadA/Sms
MAVGIDQNRLSLLLAVLEKRAGLHLVSDDVFVNIAGGMSIDEPAVDLGIIAAVASSLRNARFRRARRCLARWDSAAKSAAWRRPRSACASGADGIQPHCPAASNMDACEGMGKAELVGVRSVGEALDVLLV